MTLCFVACVAAGALLSSQSLAPPRVPSVLSNSSTGADGQLELNIPGQAAFTQRERPAAWTLRQLSGSPRGTETGIALDFANPGFNGTLVFGLVPYHQINNGAAGAPYYGQEQTPWSAFVRDFSTQHALCLLHVAGPSVRLEVVNPETLEVLDRAVLR